MRASAWKTRVSNEDIPLVSIGLRSQSVITSIDRPAHASAEFDHRHCSLKLLRVDGKELIVRLTLGEVEELVERVVATWGPPELVAAMQRIVGRRLKTTDTPLAMYAAGWREPDGLFAGEAGPTPDLGSIQTFRSWSKKNRPTPLSRPVIVIWPDGPAADPKELYVWNFQTSTWEEATSDPCA